MKLILSILALLLLVVLASVAGEPRVTPKTDGTVWCTNTELHVKYITKKQYRYCKDRNLTVECNNHRCPKTPIIWVVQ